MRKSVKIICFLFSLNLFAQTNLEPNPELQKTTYIKTIKSIEKPDKHSIMQGFLYSYKLGIDTEIGKLALKKFDSIFETEKEKLIKELQGEWLLKKVGSNWGFDEAKNKKIKLKIDRDSILFFENEKKIKAEKINFTKVEYVGLRSYTTFVYSDKLIWNYKLKNKNKLHLINEGFYNEDGSRAKISCGNLEMYYEKIK